MKALVLIYTSDSRFTNYILKTLAHLDLSYISFQNKKDAISFVSKDNSIILSIIDAGTDGIEFLKVLKLMNEHLPVLFVSTIKNTELKYQAFELGVDDCINKDIPEKELFHRIQSILKRSGKERIHHSEENSILIGTSTIDFNTRFFNFKNQQIQLSKKEADLLKVLYLNKGKLLSREEILWKVWKSNDYYSSKSMDVYLTRLRKILQNEESIELKNVHGTGYIFSTN